MARRSVDFEHVEERDLGFCRAIASMAFGIPLVSCHIDRPRPLSTISDAKGARKPRPSRNLKPHATPRTASRARAPTLEPQPSRIRAQHPKHHRIATAPASRNRTSLATTPLPLQFYCAT